MPLSGESIRELVNFYKVDEEAELIVISDDISLEPGQIRIRKKGSAGGHNGLKNIIAVLGHFFSFFGTLPPFGDALYRFMAASGPSAIIMRMASAALSASA